MKRKFMTYEGIPFRSALRPYLCTAVKAQKYGGNAGLQTNFDKLFNLK